MIRRLSLALAALAILGSGNLPAMAQAVPPPQAPITEQSVQAWIDAHIETAGWRLLAADAVAASFGAGEGVSVGDDGFLTTDIRREYYGTGQLGPNSSRSGRQTWVVDCKAKKVWVRRITIYAENNLKGASQTRENPAPKWTEISSGSANEKLMTEICRAPKDGLPRPDGPKTPT